MPDVAGYVADRVGEEYAIWDPSHARRGSFSYSPAEYVNTIMTDKVVLSSTPSHEDCLVVAIYTRCGKLAWCKCNDDKWKPLPRSGHTTVEDVIFYNGKLHALNCGGELLVYENICCNPTFQVIAKLPNSMYDIVYLVECSDGGLAMVMRITYHIAEDSLAHCTRDFNVYKLDSFNSVWVEVEDIGDDIFFFGLNSSFSVCSRDFPGYKGNFIYYTACTPSCFGNRREKDAHSDIGIFNLEDQSCVLLPGFECDHRLLWPPPVWVTQPSYY